MTKRVLLWFFDYFRRKYTNFVLHTPLVFGDASKLSISSTAIVNNALFNLSSGTITIDNYVFFGHNVSVLTGKHDIYKFNEERQTTALINQDVHIEEGAWIASGAIVLGPCIIGKHSVVGAGSVVTRDVPAYAIVAGSPARVINTIVPCEIIGRE